MAYLPWAGSLELDSAGTSPSRPDNSDDPGDRPGNPGTPLNPGRPANSGTAANSTTSANPDRPPDPASTRGAGVPKSPAAPADPAPASQGPASQAPANPAPANPATGDPAPPNPVSASILSEADRVELGEVLSNRLFTAGLDLHFVMMTLRVGPGVPRLEHAITELDEAIKDLRHLMLGVTQQLT